MEECEEVPLPKPCSKISIVYNLKKGIKTDVEDLEAEYDNITTVKAIEKVFKKYGYKVSLVEEDNNIAENLKKANPDLVFNIAEGTKGRSREGQIPALCDILGIAYSGSDAATLCIALDKSLTKRIVSTYHIKTPKSTIISNGKPMSTKGLDFPLILKPDAEGSSKGISDVSIVKNKEELKKLSYENLGKYSQDLLAEEYIAGREFTVGIVGNGKDTYVFTPMEIIFRKPTQENFCVYSFNVKKDYKKFIDYKCPSTISADIQKKMKADALKIFQVLGCKDFARVDFRTDKDGTPYFIEVNPLPGLAPSYSDFPMLADFCGVDYEHIVMKVLNSALRRLHFKTKEGV